MSKKLALNLNLILSATFGDAEATIDVTVTDNGNMSGVTTAFGSLQGDGEIAEIHPPEDQADGRHDDVAHEGGDYLAEGGTYDDTDRHVDDIAAGGKGLELLNQTHFSP